MSDNPVVEDVATAINFAMKVQNEFGIGTPRGEEIVQATEKDYQLVSYNSFWPDWNVTLVTTVGHPRIYHVSKTDGSVHVQCSMRTHHFTFDSRGELNPDRMISIATLRNL